MAVTPDDLQQLAKFLVDSGKSEAMWRAGVSRAYYAAFHKCDSFAQTDSLPELAYAEDKKGSHDVLIRRFSTYNETKMDDKSKIIRSVGYMLRSLRDHRVIADYRIEEEWKDVRTDEALMYSNRIFEKVEGLKDSNST